MAAGDLLLYIDNLTNWIVAMVWAVALLVLGGFAIFRSTQNERIVDLRITGAALVLWVVTDALGYALSFVTGFIDSILGNIGLYMSSDAIAVDVGRMVSAVLFVMAGVGIVQTLLKVAGGPAVKPAAPAATGPTKAAKAVPAAGGPPGAPGPPGPPGAPGPPGPPS